MHPTNTFCSEEVENGKKVLQLERFKYYGGIEECFIKGTDEFSSIISKSLNGTTITNENTKVLQTINLDIAPIILRPTDSLSQIIIKNNLNIDFSLIKHSKVIFINSPKEKREINLPTTKEEMMLSDDFNLLEKRQFMKCLKLQQYITATATATSESEANTFLSFLKSKGVTSPLILGIIQHTIIRKPLDKLSISDGIEMMKEHFESIMTFPSSSGLLYPIWGRSSIIEHLCRASAIKGGTVHILDQQNHLKFTETTVEGKHLKEEWKASFHKFLNANARTTENHQKVFRATAITERTADTTSTSLDTIFSTIITKENQSPIYILQHNPPLQPSLIIYYCWRENDGKIEKEFIREFINENEEIHFFANYESSTSSFFVGGGSSGEDV